MNLLEFIRKRILNNKAKHFDQNAKSLTAHLSAPGKPQAPWEDCKKHDKALLKAYSDHGYLDFVTHFNKAYGGNGE